MVCHTSASNRQLGAVSVAPVDEGAKAMSPGWSRSIPPMRPTPTLMRMTLNCRKEKKRRCIVSLFLLSDLQLQRRALLCENCTSWAFADQEHRAQAILRSVAVPSFLNRGETLPHNEELNSVWSGPWTGSRFPKRRARVPIPFDKSGGQDDCTEGVRREQVTVSRFPGPHQREVRWLDWPGYGL